MPDMPQMEYASQSKSVSTNKGGPVRGKSGPTKWANPAKTRGHKATGRTFGKKCESTFNSYTKLSSLKRGK